MKTPDSSSFLDGSLGDYLAQLSGEAPTPGGGSAAALVAALAAGLGQMVCAYTLGREKFAAVEPQVAAAAGRLREAAAQARLLIDADAAAYQALSAAFKLSKTDPRRAALVRDAAHTAALVPLRIATAAADAVRDLALLVRIGNPQLRADVEAGRRFAEAAGGAALEMVRVNLPLLDEASRTQLSADVATLADALREPGD